MNRLDKAIQGLKTCIENIHLVECPKQCPYYEACNKYEKAYAIQPVMRDALELLKAQEPRVMAYDEMMKAEICFLEVKGIEEIDPFIRFEVDGKSYWSSPYTNNKDNSFELLAEQEEYLINARCWTSRPTDEQRVATPWSEPLKEET